MLRRALPLPFLLALLLALLGGTTPAQAAKAADTDGDLAAQAAEILSLERVARHSEDVLVRDAARRQIDRLESRARARATEELGRDLFRERAAGKGAEGRERESVGRQGERDVRVFGGREVARPPRASGRERRNGDDRGRGRGDDGRDDVRDDAADDERDASDDHDDDEHDDDDDDKMDRSELEVGDDRE